jgi:hypothetical protein
MLPVPPAPLSRDHLLLLLNASSGTNGLDIKPISICTLSAPNTRSCPCSLPNIVLAAHLMMCLPTILQIPQHILVPEMMTRQMILEMMTRQMKLP